MKLEVLIGTEAELNAAAETEQADSEQLSASVRKILEDAASRMEKSVSIRMAEPGEKPSDDFQRASMIERICLNHGKTQEYPMQVQIICQDEDMARTCKMAYNFWFASEKAERMEDGKWD